MAAGFSDDEHNEEEAELETSCVTWGLRPQTSAQVRDGWCFGQTRVSVLTWSLSPLRRETFITVPSFLPQEEEEADVGTPSRLDLLEGGGLDDCAADVSSVWFLSANVASFMFVLVELSSTSTRGRYGTQPKLI